MLGITVPETRRIGPVPRAHSDRTFKRDEDGGAATFRRCWDFGTPSRTTRGTTGQRALDDYPPPRAQRMHRGNGRSHNPSDGRIAIELRPTGNALAGAGDRRGD